jgi:two-component system chemotaxis response regulator CheY
MGLQVLVVDDSSTMRKFVKKAVIASGLNVARFFEAANGEEALKQLEENWIDIIFTDINMPVMDGITFIKEAKKDPIYREVPIVVVTTEGAKEKVEEIRSLGVDAFIKKPFRPEDVRSVLLEIEGAEFELEDLPEPEGGDF